jgi:hypothetical protein
MIKTNYEQFINEEVGFRNLKMLAQKYQTAEIYFHQDLDGVCSALSMKHFIEKYYNIKVVDCHIIQYGALEYAVKHTKPDNLPIIVDYAHSKVGYILFDHHDKQSGADTAAGVYAKASRSNAEIISGEISYSDVFLSTDIQLIQTVDSANFLKFNIKPEDIQNSIFGIDKNISAERNRFLMGFVVNRLLLAMKNKRITVKSLDGKRDHNGRNLLECLVMDCSPSLYSIFVNLKHYINKAYSFEYNRATKEYNRKDRLATPEQLTKNLTDYIKTRKQYIFQPITGKTVKHPEINYDEKYKIVVQDGIGNVFAPGSYDRYVVFKNFPDAEFVCTIFPMGLIQISCNPFKEKRLKSVNLGEITQEVLSKYKYELSNIRIGVSDIKRINEEEIGKMKNKYGPDYVGMGFKFSDLQSLYKDSIVYLPGRKAGDLKNRAQLDLTNEELPEVQLLKQWMDKNISKWPFDVQEEINHLKIPVLDIITQSSGGHPSITNIQGFNYMSTRRDLMERLFKTGNFADVMKMVAQEFLTRLKARIDAEQSGSTVSVSLDPEVKLKGSINVD